MLKVGSEVGQTYKVPKVRSFSHMTEQADLNDPSQHLDQFQNLREKRKKLVGPDTIPEAKTLTLKGSLRSSVEKGASMMKFPLSLTTGPAFAFPILSLGFWDPRRTRFCRTFA